LHSAIPGFSLGQALVFSGREKQVVIFAHASFASQAYQNPEYLFLVIITKNHANKN